jgi:hypothetical protein
VRQDQPAGAVRAGEVIFDLNDEHLMWMRKAY